MLSIFFIIPILGLGIYFLLRFLRNVQPTESEVDQDLKELKDKVKQFKGGFMPWTDEISSNQIDQILTPCLALCLAAIQFLGASFS